MLQVSIWGAVAVVVALGAWYASEALDASPVTVNGVQIPQVAIDEWAEAYDSRWRATEMTLLIDGRVLRRSRGVFGAVLDGTRLAELRESFPPGERSRKGLSIDWRPRVDRDGPVEPLAQIRAELRSAEGARGNLDLLASKRLIRQALQDGSLVVELPITVIERIENLELDPESLSFARTLGGHRSEYRTKGKSLPRARNIELAARLIDGVVIAPGAELSFNEAVGPRTFGLGFGPGPEIVGGKVVDGIGGGICQVATALHAAALRSAFQITEHYPHSKRPKYAKLGIDSAVAWGHKDLRIRNPFSDYVRVWAEAGRGALVVELRADRPKIDVEIVPTIVKGTQTDRSKPLVVKRVRTMTWPDGVRVEEETIWYPAEKPKG